MNEQQPPNGNALSRREFLRVAGTAALTAAVGLPGLLELEHAEAQPTLQSKAETFVKKLRESLTEEQKKTVLLPWGDPRRTRIQENWRIVEPGISQFYTPEQQELIREILKNLTSKTGYDKLQKQMQDDYGGLGNYTCCIFHDPGSDRMEWVLTGRHLTLRADGNTTPGAAFGGPIFYGHAVEDTERPDHPSNVWWHQARLANQVFDALDGKQKAIALIEKSPPEGYDSIKLQGAQGKFVGLPVSEFSRDQKGLLQRVTRALLEPFRKEDVDEVLKLIRASGGWDKYHLSFYQEGDLGDDKIWDRWKLEGPAFVWYFRGSPHVHAWVNVGNAGNGK